MSRKVLLLVLVCLPAIALCDVDETVTARVPAEEKVAPVEFSSTKRYSTLYDAENFYQAHIHCLDLGMQLPIVYSEQDSADLFKEIQRHGGVDALWLGLNDEADGKFYWWSNGHPLNYTSKWAKSQPNGGEGCAIMISNGRWHDYPCKNQYPFVCEKKEGC